MEQTTKTRPHLETIRKLQWKIGNLWEKTTYELGEMEGLLRYCICASEDELLELFNAVRAMLLWKKERNKLVDDDFDAQDSLYRRLLEEGERDVTLEQIKEAER